MEKKIIRKQIKEKLNLVKTSFINQSKEVCEQIINNKFYKESTSIFLYMALNDELDLSFLLHNALENNKNVYLPRIISGTNQMDFYKIENTLSIKNQIENGSFGIQEPIVLDKNKFEVDKQIHNQKIMILVPGRAFSKSGKRVGRGKGFYDLYLSKILNNKYLKRENLLICGVCFLQQIMDEEEIDCTNQDVKMDCLFFSFDRINP